MLARITSVRHRGTIGLIVCWLVSFVPCLSGGQSITVLNMSHDLVAYGIAASNLLPDTPSQDARALFEKAVTYAVNNNIATVTADPGSYYFLSLHGGTTAHAYLNAAANITIDWQGSDLYFANSNYAAITCANCNAVTMQNFTVDYQQLPFTQATITAVDSANAALTYATIPGYQDPSAFNTNRAADGSDAIWIFMFRNGVPLATVGRLSGKRPVNGNVITIGNTNVPWANAAALATIQPGDVAVFTDRSGPPALNFVQGQNITVHNVSIYSSGAIALYFGRTLAPTADHVQIIPRPGTTRLISSNADGIHTSFANGANTFTNNIVERTCDDELAIAAEWLANVTATPTSATTVTVSRSIVGVPFPEQTAVSFLNPATDTIVGSATIESETPPSTSQTLAANESVVLTLNQPVAGLATGYEMIYSDPARHGSGSVIAGNVAEQGVFSRGIWLSGVNNVSVHDNTVTQTSKVGIFIEELAAAPGSGNLEDTAPSSGVTVQNNLVDNSINFGGVSEGVLVSAGSIQVLSVGGGGGQVTSSPNTNIAIENNLVSNAPRSAIRVENASTGQINGNTIQGYSMSPKSDVYQAPSCCETLTQFESDFTQSVVVMSSTGVTNSSNTSAPGTGGLISSVSVASYFPKAAPGSLVGGFWNNPAVTNASSSAPFPPSLGGISVSVTDSAGTSRPAPLYFITPNIFSFVVPDGTASGIATVSSGSFSGRLLIDTIAPGIYSQNSSGEGVAAGTWQLFSSDGTALSFGYTANLPCMPGTCVAVPVSLGDPGDYLVLSLYGTGMRNVGATPNVHATIGGITAQVTYVGPQGYQALDQVNITVPAALAGAGEVPIVLTVDGQTANTVTMSLK